MTAPSSTVATTESPSRRKFWTVMIMATKVAPAVQAGNRFKLPVPETIARLAGAHRVETASWSSDWYRGRLRPKEPIFHHPITETVFELVEDPTNYAHKQ